MRFLVEQSFFGRLLICIDMEEEVKLSKDDRFIISCGSSGIAVFDIRTKQKVDRHLYSQNSSADSEVGNFQVAEMGRTLLIEKEGIIKKMPFVFAYNPVIYSKQLIAFLITTP